jgi:hypothetical protein
VFSLRNRSRGASARIYAFAEPSLCVYKFLCVWDYLLFCCHGDGQLLGVFFVVWACVLCDALRLVDCQLPICACM